MIISDVFQFASPASLWALLAVLFAIPAFVLATQGKLTLRAQVLLSTILGLGIVTAGFSLAQPQKVFTFRQKAYPPHAFVALLDDSGSTGFCFDRKGGETWGCAESTVFETFRSELKSFAEWRQPDKIGLTVFSDSVEIVSRIDEGTDTTIQRLAQYKPRYGNTYFLDAARKGLEQLRHSKEIARVLLIMSDGDDLVERRELDSFIDEIRKSRISVYWIQNDLHIQQDERDNLISLRKEGGVLLEQAGVKIIKVEDQSQMQRAFNHINVLEMRINFLSERVTAVTDYTWQSIWVPAGLILSFFSFWLMLARSSRKGA